MAKSVQKIKGFHPSPKKKKKKKITHTKKEIEDTNNEDIKNGAGSHLSKFKWLKTNYWVTVPWREVA